VEWCMRIGQAGWKIFYQPSCRVIHLGGQSTRKNLEEMLVTSQRSLYYVFQRHLGGGKLFVLRVLTVIEMLLRSVLWGTVFVVAPRRRSEATPRLHAYRQILGRTLVDASYWAPAEKK
jgi:GT2 family glycosyltransferase